MQEACQQGGGKQGGEQAIHSSQGNGKNLQEGLDGRILRQAAMAAAADTGMQRPRWREEFAIAWKWQQRAQSTIGGLLQGVWEWPMAVHCSFVVAGCWMAGKDGWSLPFVFMLSMFYLWEIAKRQRIRMIHRIRHEERKAASRRKPMSESETVRWLNTVTERMWPTWLEHFLSQEVLPSLAPWFFDKYRPWQLKQAVLQRLYLGSAGPLLATARIVPTHGYDDHVVLEMAGEFVASPDMYAVIAGQPLRRFGLGLWGTCHVSNLIIEGKVLVGMKFLPGWPYVSRLRLSFAGAPYVSVTVRPIINFGIDIAELPGISGWLDKMLATALENSMVEPNMLVVDVQKLIAHYMPTPAGPQSSSAPAHPTEFLQVKEMEPRAQVLIELLEAKNLKASDSNGFSDPYVKGALGAARFKTNVKRKTLSPQWFEEFRAPIPSWEKPNLLVLRVRDKDMFKSDELGYCVLDLSRYRGGQRIEFWEELKTVKTGKLRLAITIIENDKHEMADGSSAQIPSGTNLQEENRLKDSVFNSTAQILGETANSGTRALTGSENISNSSTQMTISASAQAKGLGFNPRDHAGQGQEDVQNMAEVFKREGKQERAGKTESLVKEDSEKKHAAKNSTKIGILIEEKSTNLESRNALRSVGSLEEWKDLTSMQMSSRNRTVTFPSGSAKGSEEYRLLFPRQASKSAPVTPICTSPSLSPRSTSSTPTASHSAEWKAVEIEQSRKSTGDEPGMGFFNYFDAWTKGKTSVSPPSQASSRGSHSPTLRHSSAFSPQRGQPPFGSSKEVDQKIPVLNSTPAVEVTHLGEYCRVKDETEVVDVGVGPPGFVTLVRPGEGATDLEYKGRTGGRRSEAAARAGYLEGEGRKSILEAALETLTGKHPHAEGDFDAKGVTCTWRGEETALEDLDKWDEDTTKPEKKKWKAGGSKKQKESIVDDGKERGSSRSLSSASAGNAVLLAHSGWMEGQDTLHTRREKQEMEEERVEDKGAVVPLDDDIDEGIQSLRSKARTKRNMVMKSIDAVTNVFRKSS